MIFIIKTAENRQRRKFVIASMRARRGVLMCVRVARKMLRIKNVKVAPKGINISSLVPRRS